jgi:hypothetical protein
MIAWFKASQLAPWLNEWNTIESEFSDIWISQKTTTTKFQIYLAIFYFLVPSLLYGSMLAPVQFNLEYPIHSFVVVTYVYFSFFCYVAEDAKAILMFKCLQVGFDKVIFAS